MCKKNRFISQLELVTPVPSLSKIQTDWITGIWRYMCLKIRKYSSQQNIWDIGHLFILILSTKTLWMFPHHSATQLLGHKTFVQETSQDPKNHPHTNLQMVGFYCVDMQFSLEMLGFVIFFPGTKEQNQGKAVQFALASLRKGEAKAIQLNSLMMRIGKSIGFSFSALHFN